MRTLSAIAREMLSAALRILTGALLAIFFLAYALGGVVLLPVVVLALVIVALPGQLRAASPRMRVSAWRLRRAVLSARVQARAALGWWLSLDR